MNFEITAMSRGKASKVVFASPYNERIKKYYLQFFKGTFYQKVLRGNSHIQFLYGYYSFPKPYPLTFHKELELVYVQRGGGGYYLAGKIYPFKKRLLLIAKPNDIHAMMRAPQKERPKVMVMVFPPAWLGLKINVKSWPREVLLNEDEAGRLDLVCGQISEEVEKRLTGFEDMLKAKFQEVFCLIRRIVSRPKGEGAHLLADQLREYIDRHFAEKISILDIAKKFNYTKQHLERAFKKSMGLSLKRYILQRRVIEARILLETQPALKVAAVSERVGFEDYRLFHRIFKILAGVNPKAYQNAVRRS